MPSSHIRDCPSFKYCKVWNMIYRYNVNLLSNLKNIKIQNCIYECLKLIIAHYFETLIGISTKTIGAYALNFRSMTILNRNKIVFP